MEHLLNNICTSKSESLGIVFMFIPLLVDNTIVSDGYVFNGEYISKKYISSTLSLDGVELANSDQVNQYLDAFNNHLTNKYLEHETH